MKRTQNARDVKRVRGPLAALAMAVFLSTAAGLATAQDGAGEEQAKPAKFRGRLPAYFSRVVSQKQREQIYTIQGGYADQLSKLEMQIRELEAARDKEVREVLTPAQKKQVDAMMAAAKARRSGDTPPAPPAPAPPDDPSGNGDT